MWHYINLHKPTSSPENRKQLRTWIQWHFWTLEGRTAGALGRHEVVFVVCLCPLLPNPGFNRWVAQPNFLLTYNSSEKSKVENLGTNGFFLCSESTISKAFQPTVQGSEPPLSEDGTEFALLLLILCFNKKNIFQQTTKILNYLLWVTCQWVK